MSYGTATYGSTAIGGAVGAIYTFFPYREYAEGDYEAQLELATDEQFFSVLIRQSSEAAAGDPFMETRIYTSNDSGETPQLQVTQGDALFAQQVVGAARFITVRVTVFLGQQFSITGRPGD